VLLDELGRGGMGVVFRAWQEDLQRLVAVKMLVGPAEAELKARFLREARVASRLKHPNIVQVHEYGEDGERAWFSMELVEGTSSDALFRPRGVDPRAAMRLVGTVARALHYAHGQGVVHRDIKPQNTTAHENAGEALTPPSSGRTPRRTRGTRSVSNSSQRALRGTRCCGVRRAGDGRPATIDDMKRET